MMRQQSGILMAKGWGSERHNGGYNMLREGVLRGGMMLT